MTQPTINEMLAGLIHAGAVGITSAEIKIKTVKGDLRETKAILVYVDLTDLFRPGNEQYILEPDFIKELWEYTTNKDYKGFGHYVWTCVARNQKPVRNLIQQMKDAGAWNDTLEALPDNEFETAVNKTLH